MTKFESPPKRLAVFCGSRVGVDPVFADAARALAASMVRQGFGLVFGAGHVGLMGVLADAVLAANGEAIGVIPQGLVDRELAHLSLTELHVVGTMHERKKKMADLADGFVALPGGYGTLDETFEMLTWHQLKIHSKPIAWLNVAGFFDPLFAWIDRAIDADFVKPKNRDIFFVNDDPETVVAEMARRIRHGQDVRS